MFMGMGWNSLRTVCPALRNQTSQLPAFLTLELNGLSLSSRDLLATAMANHSEISKDYTWKTRLHIACLTAKMLLPPADGLSLQDPTAFLLSPFSFPFSLPPLSDVFPSCGLNSTLLIIPQNKQITKQK